MHELDIVLRSHGQRVSHKAPNRKSFTVGDLVEVIRLTELKTRGNSAWFDGVDVHHIFFEGLSWSDEHDAYEVHWGS